LQIVEFILVGHGCDGGYRSLLRSRLSDHVQQQYSVAQIRRKCDARWDELSGGE
jgi:hypothetical protein